MRVWTSIIINIKLIIFAAIISVIVRYHITILVYTKRETIKSRLSKFNISHVAEHIFNHSAHVFFNVIIAFFLHLVTIMNDNSIKCFLIIYIPIIYQYVYILIRTRKN